jgi:hypothetical protein
VHVEVHRTVEGLLVQVGTEEDEDSSGDVGNPGGVVITAPGGDSLEKAVPGEDVPDPLVVQGRQGELLEVVGALDAAGRLARRLDGRQE